MMYPARRGSGLGSDKGVLSEVRGFTPPLGGLYNILHHHSTNTIELLKYFKRSMTTTQRQQRQPRAWSASTNTIINRDQLWNGLIGFHRLRHSTIAVCQRQRQPAPVQLIAKHSFQPSHCDVIPLTVVQLHRGGAGSFGATTRPLQRWPVRTK